MTSCYETAGAPLHGKQSYVRTQRPIPGAISPVSLSCLLMRFTTFLRGVLLGAICSSLLTSKPSGRMVCSASGLLKPGEGLLLHLKTPPAASAAQFRLSQGLIMGSQQKTSMGLSVPHPVWRCTQRCGHAPLTSWVSPKCVTFGHPRLQAKDFLH